MGPTKFYHFKRRVGGPYPGPLPHLNRVCNCFQRSLNRTFVYKKNRHLFCLLSPYMYMYVYIINNVQKNNNNVDKPIKFTTHVCNIIEPFRGIMYFSLTPIILVVQFAVRFHDKSCFSHLRTAKAYLFICASAQTNKRIYCLPPKEWKRKLVEFKWIPCLICVFVEPNKHATF